MKSIRRKICSLLFDWHWKKFEYERHEKIDISYYSCRVCDIWTVLQSKEN